MGNRNSDVCGLIEFIHRARDILTVRILKYFNRKMWIVSLNKIGYSSFLSGAEIYQETIVSATTTS